MKYSTSSVIAAAGFFAVGVDAFWRMECRARVGLARVDPLMNFGTPATHVHAIHGSNGFSPTANYGDLVAGDCTSCAVTQDRSAYWHPALYFQDASTNEFELVDQVGGMLAYYLLNDQDIKAFPAGFRMIAGDTDRRNYTAGDPSQPDPPKSAWSTLGQTKQSDLEQRAIGFNCLNYARAPEGTLYRHALPDKAFLDANCADGVRFEMMFPSCWNGKDVDSPDHKSHMAYPDLVMTGTCPDGFETSVPNLLYEVIWDTAAYKSRNGRFVIANGDLQGFGYHADFMSGWDEDFLQSAVNTCTNLSGRIEDCPLFNIQSDDKAAQCQMKVPSVLSLENVTGPVTSLPGNVIITGDPSTEGGPAPVIPSPSSSSSAPAAPPALSYKPGKTASANPVPGEVLKAMPTSASTPVPIIQEVTPTPTSSPQPSMSFASIQTITNGNVVSVIYWEEDVVYVTMYDDITSTTTVTPTPTPVLRAKRHLHQHRHHL
ncbi:hypothetical protein CGRA01v4_03966 [Colletotrichum graminicola]|uniref:DUF1996 domain-containing protein n=1 Tax=Colletotrichum graminicola (strain M1.001 / M2 / FGSC 10212) TaxID=645133 RepID=E3QTP9_COLGM|nr:uncharacterized protein GLRG_09355 [Colletotrichum graminicola M1.001]EFQ34211.1 hypothetical protein GLRG_09355 [Colletotrichum graminicola M1.001]WDK12686.1 hypothetical protein CGRA01v4_03966 [Colletotrichum graminicola]